MTDKEIIIDKIKQLKDLFKTERENTSTTDKGMVDKLSFSSKIVVLEELLAFINLLPAEPSEEVEENIEGKINEYWNEWFSHGEYFEGTLPKNVFAAYCHKIANWQKEQIMKSAIDGCYIIHNRYNKENVLNSIRVTCNAIQKFKHGDKVKVIIVKEANNERNFI